MERWTWTPAGFLVLALVLALPGGIPTASTHVTASGSRALPTARGGPHAPRTDVLWENTSIVTLDRGVANNSGLSFSMQIDPGSLSTGQNLTVRLSEPLANGEVLAGGFVAVEENGPTVALPFLALPNGTMVRSDAPIDLDGEFTLGFQRWEGDWWGPTLDGGSWNGSRPWENGSYDLGQGLATGILGAGGSLSSAPALTFEEAGPQMPLSLLFTVPRVFSVDLAGSSYDPLNGRLLAATPSNYSVAFTGHNQSSAAPYDAVFSPGSAPTTANGTTLWGNLSSTQVLPASIVGAYTNDSRFANNVTAGISLEYELPPSLSGGQVSLAEVALPITTSETAILGYASLNYDSVPISVPELAISTDLGQNVTVYIDEHQVGDGFDVDNLSLQHAHGDWWTAYVNGFPFSATSGIGGSGTTNGTLDLGVDSALGVNSRPFHANTSFATQPTFFFQGNLTPLLNWAAFSLQSADGAWWSPSWGLAWSIDATQDVLLGPDQGTGSAPGNVTILNASASYPAPLANGTVLWSPTWSLQLRATPPTVVSGGTGALWAWTNESGQTLPGLGLTTSVNNSGFTVGAFTWDAAAGAYVANLSAGATLVPLSSEVVVIALGAALPFDLRASTDLTLLPLPALDVSAELSRGETSLTVPAGDTVTIFIFVNGTGDVGIDPEAINVSANVSGGTFGSLLQRGLGTFAVSYATPALGGVDEIMVGANESGYRGWSWASLNLTLQLGPLTLGPVGISGEGSFLARTGATFSVFANVSSNGTPVQGASVLFQFTPSLGSSAVSAVTNPFGEAQLVLPVPATPAGATADYTVVARATESHRQAAQTAATPFVVKGPALASTRAWVPTAEIGAVVGLSALVVILTWGRIRLRPAARPGRSKAAPSTKSDKAGSPSPPDPVPKEEPQAPSEASAEK